MTLLLYVYSFQWLDVPDPVLWVGGLAVWLAVVFVVSVVIGMVVHGRDRQVPAALSDRPLPRDDQGGTP